MLERSVEIGVRFRLCRADDLRALEWMGLYTRDREVIEAAYRAQCREEGAMLLGIANGFPVAQAWLEFAPPAAPERPRIWAVRVFPAMQGAGLGRRLMAAAERLAAGRGAVAVELGVETENDPAYRFYHRLGYRRAGARCERVRYSFEGYPLEAEFRQAVLLKPLLRRAAGGGREGGCAASQGSGRRLAQGAA